MSRRVVALGAVLSSLVVACSALTDVADLSGGASAAGAAGAIANGGQSAGNGGSGGLAKGGSAGAPNKGGAAGAGPAAGAGGSAGAGTGGSAGGGMAGATSGAGAGGAQSGGTGGTGGSASGSAGNTQNGGSAGNAGSAGGGAVYPCDKDTAGDGIYVSPSGTQGATGTATAPVRSIVAAIELANAQKKTTVYIEEGAYGESIVLGESFGKAINLDGGWRRIGGTWTRLCGDAAATTIIQGPNGRALEVNNSPGKVRVRHLTLTTYADLPEPGRSHYAVFAVGTPTKPVSIDLEDVLLTPGKGEDGAPVQDAEPAGVRSCNGSTDCNGGTNGGPGKAADIPQKGTFNSSGYVPPISGTGGNGSPGGNGKQGTASLEYTNCDVSCTIAGTTCAPAKGTKTLTGATCGCGGEGGKGGPGGRAGGASIGLFVSGSAKVVALGSTVRTGVGGNGSPPGGAAKGASGSVGKGVPGICCANTCPASATGTACTDAVPTEPTPCADPRAGITAWGNGSQGGDGGVGAHGLGGPSICVVAHGGGDAQIGDSVVLKADLGGSSGGVLPPGESRPFLNLP